MRKIRQLNLTLALGSIGLRTDKLGYVCCAGLSRPSLLWHEWLVLLGKVNFRRGDHAYHSAGVNSTID